MRPVVSLNPEPVALARVVARRDLQQERPGLQRVESQVRAGHLYSASDDTWSVAGDQSRPV